MKLLDQEDIREEIRYPEIVLINEKVLRVSCGNDFAACISEGGRLYTWGRGSFGNLGHGDTENRKKPSVVNALNEVTVVDTSCGAKHMMAITNEFKIYSWGNGGNGRLGHGDTSGTSVPIPIQHLFNESIMSVSCGESHSAAISTLGELFTWGAGTHGRLGHG